MAAGTPPPSGSSPESPAAPGPQQSERAPLLPPLRKRALLIRFHSLSCWEEAEGETEGLRRPLAPVRAPPPSSQRDARPANSASAAAVASRNAKKKKKAQLKPFPFIPFFMIYKEPSTYGHN